mmetsp:Transcript_54606/g.158001  ORF Transcript_54606/g.158001 Transcript_54606/m.158001 type:complete len:205 (-) Transcript_54606:2492-3106(-)
MHEVPDRHFPVCSRELRVPRLQRHGDCRHHDHVLQRDIAERLRLPSGHPSAQESRRGELEHVVRPVPVGLVLPRRHGHAVAGGRLLRGDVARDSARSVGLGLLAQARVPPRPDGHMRRGGRRPHVHQMHIARTLLEREAGDVLDLLRDSRLLHYRDRLRGVGLLDGISLPRVHGLGGRPRSIGAVGDRRRHGHGVVPWPGVLCI